MNVHEKKNIDVIEEDVDSLRGTLFSTVVFVGGIIIVTIVLLLFFYMIRI